MYTVGEKYVGWHRSDNACPVEVSECADPTATDTCSFPRSTARLLDMHMLLAPLQLCPGATLGHFRSGKGNCDESRCSVPATGFFYLEYKEGSWCMLVASAGVAAHVLSVLTRKGS